MRRAIRFTTQALRNLFEIPAELKALEEEAGEETQEETEAQVGESP